MMKPKQLILLFVVATAAIALSACNLQGLLGYLTNNPPGTKTTEVTGVSVSPASATVSIGGTEQLSDSVQPSDATNQNVRWTSSNASVATVSSSGLVTGVAAGSVTITVATTDGGYTASSSITVSGNGGTVKVTGVSVSPTSATVYINGTQQLTDTIQPSNATNQGVTWSSSNSSVATVSTSGLVKGVSSGSATITVTTADGSYTASSSITVGGGSSGGTVKVTGVSVSPTSAAVSIGGTQQLSDTIQPSNATNQNVTWSSSNSSVATVSTAGLVTGMSAGTATITATTADGSYTASSSITVSKGTIAVTGVSVSPTSASVLVGNTQQLSDTIQPSNATNQSVTWSSSNTSVATVSTTGLVTGVSAGSATITVTTADGSHTASSSISVSSKPVAVTGVSVSPTTATVYINGTQQLSDTIQPSDATNRTVTWSSSNTSVASVDSSGLVTGIAGGTAKITVTTVDGGYTASSSITVTPAPTISSFTVSPSTITIGQSANLAWVASNATSLSIQGVASGLTPSGNRNVTPASTGSYTYTLTASNPSGTVTKSVSLSVVALPSITSFTANNSSSTTILLTQSATLNWTTANATSASISPTFGGVSTNGSRNASPTAKTTYTLTAKNAAGASTTATVTVAVDVELFVQSGGNGSVNANGGSFASSTSAKLPVGQNFNVSASAATNYHFASWSLVSGSASIASTNSDPTAVTVSSEYATVQANFQVNTGNIAVVVNNRTQNGLSSASGAQVTVMLYQVTNGSYNLLATKGTTTGSYTFSGLSVLNTYSVEAYETNTAGGMCTLNPTAYYNPACREFWSYNTSGAISVSANATNIVTLDRIEPEVLGSNSVSVWYGNLLSSPSITITVTNNDVVSRQIAVVLTIENSSGTIVYQSTPLPATSFSTIGANGGTYSVKFKTSDVATGNSYSLEVITKESGSPTYGAPTDTWPWIGM